MATRGRRPKIGGRRALVGPARIVFAALNPHAGTPEPPGPLEEPGLYAWVEACRSLIPARQLSHGDLPQLYQYAVAFQRWWLAEAEARETGDYQQTPNGMRILSAARINANQAGAVARDIASRFGLDPVARIKTSESAQGDLFSEAPRVASGDIGANVSPFRALPVRGVQGAR